MKKLVCALLVLGAVTSLSATATATKAADTTKSVSAGKKIVRKKAAKGATKAMRKSVHAKRDDLFESLEDKVARESKKGNYSAIDKAFETGNQRLAHIRREESNIQVLSGEFEPNVAEHEFNSVKYDEVVASYQDAKARRQILDKEHEELLARKQELQRMKKAIKK